MALATAKLYRGMWSLDDEVYDPLSRAFVQLAHADWVASLPPVLRTMRDVGGGKTIAVPRYIPEVFDCDNIARSFANYIDEACAVDAATRRVVRGNPAFGKFNFTADVLGRHARNWHLDYDGVAHVFDAGLGDYTPPSEPELATVDQGESI